ncbi:hypothetical protein GHC57_06410 [Roseospira navarrensis]|uniref:Uncharacterized protein n=1 Tax=Roseospira navarrensis TaxID=140058 RepID=A0A7X1ZD53_9PROT|nr:hypothetical protein [Roseospira navarrensis]
MALGQIALGLGLSLGLGGCGANQASIYRDYAVNSRDGETTTSVLIDAKQRAVLSVALPPAAQTAPTGGGGMEPRTAVVCAEPSPDTLSAISSTLASARELDVSGLPTGSEAAGAEASAAEVGYRSQLARTLTEVAAELGSRNATIQLLRDGLYRACEAHMNGLIDRAYYEEISNKYANAMVTLLAIEQLTPRGRTETTTTTAQPSSSTVRGAPGSGEGGSGGAGATASAAPTVVTSSTVAPAQPPNDASIRAVSIMVSLFLTKDTLDYCLGKLDALAPRSPDEVALCREFVAGHVTQQEVLAGAFAQAIGRQ